MSFDALKALRSAGVLTGDKSPAVEQVLNELSKEEVGFLISLHTRVAAAITPEVGGHSLEEDEDAPCIMGQTVIIR